MGNKKWGEVTSLSLWFMGLALLSLAACHTEDITLQENHSPSVSSVNLSQKKRGWEEVVREMGIGPYEKSLEGRTLKLVIANKEPFNDLSFENFLVELGSRLGEVTPPFRAVMIQAKGPEKSLYQARIERTDVEAYRSQTISRPELSRRFQVKVQETLESLREKALAARREGRTSDALLALEQWIERDPRSQSALSLLGNVYRDEKRYWDAIGVYQKLPPTLFVFHNLGFCYEKVGAYEDSIKNYEKGLDVDVENKILMRQLADVLRKDGVHEKALEQIKKARLLADSSELWLIEGNIYRDSKKYKQAREAYNKAKTLDPQNSKALFNLLLVDLDMKQYEEAGKKYQELKTKDALLARQLAGIDLFQEE